MLLQEVSSFVKCLTEIEFIKAVYSGLISTLCFTLLFYLIRPRLKLPKRLYFVMENKELKQINIKVRNNGFFRANNVEIDMVVIDSEDITETFLFKKSHTFSIKSILSEKESTYTFATKPDQTYLDIFR